MDHAQSLEDPTPCRIDVEPKKKHHRNNQSAGLSRCTRSQLAPDWTLLEMLTLASEVAAVNEDCLKSLSSYQRWKIIADNCAVMDVVRSANQCRRKWDQMLAEYKLVRNWEIRSGTCSYWGMEADKKREHGLPLVFHRELFETLANVLKAEESRLEKVADSESESPVLRSIEAGKLQVAVDQGRKKGSSGARLCRSNPEKEQKLAGKLRESAELVQSILRGDLSEGSSINGMAGADMSRIADFQAELTRQGDELIKVFGTLASTLDQLVELVDKSG